jgi:transcriptional regulator with XRE-family HTH domain
VSNHAVELRRLVKKSTRTHQEVSDSSGVPARSLRGYLSGERSPTLPAVRKLLSALGGDLDVFQVRALPVRVPKRRRGIAPIASTDPLLLDLLAIMNELGVTTTELYARTGHRGDTLREWVVGEVNPSMSSLDNCFAALGYELRIVE